ncbi:dynamin family protein [Microseira sp. BLCC-F43]|jgi:Fe2+ transport system protein B|uniref:dynamin family protein n=1 Tax=Microseira sp. BLCC-F43 TaxID=3153602 RepID=UPI0035B6B8AD
METMTNKIRYDFAALRQEFLEIFQDFSTAMDIEKVRRVLGKNLFKQLGTQENQIRDRLAGEFSLVVVGDFKRGKSTLINALLGTQIVTTNVTPETVSINQIQYGRELKIQACLADGGRISLEPEDLSAERLLPILDKLPQKVSHLSIDAPVEWLQGMRLVDTPGTGDIFKQFDSQVHAYLSQADAVIFVISALSPLSMSERAFLQLAILPQDFPKLFFVVNMMDMARSDADAQRLLDTITTKITRLFPNARVFGVSALDEFCRIQSLGRPNPERAQVLEADFQIFRDCLQESILLNRDLIHLNRATAQMERILQGLESQISLLRQAMQTDKLRLSQAVAQCENESSELVTKIKQHKQIMQDAIAQFSEQACQWMTEFIIRLQKEAIATIPNYQMNDIRRHYHFFLTNSLRKAISLCLDAHRAAIVKSAEQTITAISEDFHSLIDLRLSDTKVAKVTFGDLAWTNFDTLQMVLHYSPFELISDLLIGQARMSQGASQTNSFQEKLKNALPELASSLTQQIQSVYNNIAAKIEQQIETAYQQDIEKSLETLRQAQELSAAGEQKIATTDQDLPEILSILTDTRSALKGFKQKLWSEIGGTEVKLEVFPAT